MPRASHNDPQFLILQAALAGRYSLERELGRGGMGVVYLARDVQLDRPVALKLLPPNSADLPEVRSRFLHEARAAARLAHPNVVPIYTVDEAGPYVFMAMRFVAGESLGVRLRRATRLDPAQTARVLRDVAYALAYAHAHQVVHRDIKPDNILLEAESESALVADFGIARLDGHHDAHHGRVVGTPEYLSPEQACGLAVSPSADLYSLGVVGFHCLAGTPPFVGSTEQLLEQHRLASPPSLAALAPDAPPALVAAIERLLAKEPVDRFESAEAFAEAIAPATASPRELAVPVRIWAERGRELKGTYVIWSCFFYGMGVMALVGGMLNGGFPLAVIAFIVLCACAVAAPWIGHTLWRILETRKAIEGGATLDDFREASRLAVRRREEELRFENSRPVHVISRTIRTLTYIAFGCAVATLAAGVLWHPRYLSPSDFFLIFSGCTMAGVGGALFGLVFPGRRPGTHDLYARTRRAIWNSKLGEVLVHAASIGLPPVTHPWSDSHATETALGAATEALFAGLSASARTGLDALPGVVHRLEWQAQVARAELARNGGRAWAVRLEQAVAAIESLRLGLLRLAAGQIDRGPLTADLAAAAELSQRVDYLIAGSDEVAELLRHGPGIDPSRPGATATQSSTHATPRVTPPSTSLG